MTRKQLLQRINRRHDDPFRPFSQTALLYECLDLALSVKGELDSDLLRACFDNHFRSVGALPRDASARARSTVQEIEKVLACLDKTDAEVRDKREIAGRIGGLLISENAFYRKAYDSTFESFKRREEALERFFKKVQTEVSKLDRSLQSTRRKQKTLRSFITQEDKDFELWLKELSESLAKHKDRQLRRARSTLQQHFRNHYHGPHTFLPESRTQIIQIVDRLDGSGIYESQATDLLAEILIAAGLFGSTESGGTGREGPAIRLKRQHNKLKRKVKDRLRRILQREVGDSTPEDYEET
jgi:hypothetical protein